MNIIKTVGFIALFTILGFLGYRVYNYFFITDNPQIEFIGLLENGNYSGQVNAAVNCKHPYKVKDISVYLDGKPLIIDAYIGKKSIDFPLILPKGLSNGNHNLVIKLRAGSYNQSEAEKNININIDNNPLQASFVRPGFDYKVFQGRTLHIQFQANKKLKIAKLKTSNDIHNCYAEGPNSTIYECFVPIACEENPNEYPFSIEIEDLVGNKMQLDGKYQIMPFAFKKQILKVSKEKVKHEAEVSLPQQELEKELAEVYKKSPQEKLWNGSFYIPIEMTGITTDYGVKRITQEKGCYTHKALDLIGAPRTVVWAPQDGIVVIKNRYESSGNTVVVDHGCGVFSLLFHLEDFANVNVGDKVRRGNPVGTLGMTGYATGYHLHWEMRINNIHVDPMQWVKDDF